MLGGGNSSLSIWTPFDSMCTATVRPLKARCLIAWTRQQKTTGFAIIGVSKIGGTDIIQGVGDNVLNDADLYDYFDETDRVLQLEYERHLIEPLGGSAVAVANITLDNTDLRFTPDYNSTIGTAIRPNRPIKMHIGFEINGQEVTIPVIEALSQQPLEDKMKRVITIQATDFITFLDGIPQETSVYEGQRTDAIIADILSRAGIGSSNYVLDEGLNTPGFVGFGVGDFAGKSIQELCEAEEAIFYQDELGIYRYENRQKFSQYPYTEPAWTINPEDIIEWGTQQSTQIINHIIVSGKPRSVKGEVEVWRDGTEEEVVPGGQLVVTAQFNDPVLNLQAPEYLVDYLALDHPNGAGSDISGSVTVTVEAFTNTAQITLTNNHPTQVAHFYYLKLRGNPATVDYEISEVYEDTASVGTYNEQDQTVQNDYIQGSGFAQLMAKDIVNRYKNPSDVVQIKIRGVPQLQLRDMIRTKEPDLGTYSRYRLIGIQGIFQPGSFVQTLTLRKITINEVLSATATPPTYAIVEDWRNGSINPAKWNDLTGLQSTIVSKKLQLTSYISGGIFGVDTRINTHTYFDLTGGYVSNQLVSAGNQALTSFQAIPVIIKYDKDSSNYQMYFSIQGNVVYIKKVLAGVTSTITSFQYKPEIHQYFRIREAGGSTFFEFSPDSVVFQPITSVKNLFDITQVDIGMQIMSSSEASVTIAIFDNFNIIA